jgi:hypothetical protein
MTGRRDFATIGAIIHDAIVDGGPMVEQELIKARKFVRTRLRRSACE